MAEPLPKVEVEEVSQVERTLRVEIPVETVKRHLDLAYQALSQEVRVPGFRPGKVPRRILEQRYRQSVEDRVIGNLTQGAYLQALEDKSVDAVSSPQLTVDPLKPGAPLTFQARVQVRPRPNPTDYQGLELNKVEPTVTDEQVSERMEAIRQRMARVEPVAGRDVARAGDWATIDYTATIDGQPFPGSTADNITARVEPGELVESKIAALEGMKVGETKTIDYAFPPSYQVEEVKGKTGRFEITLKGLKVEVVPELNDELAKELGAGETVAQMREKVRADMLAAETQRARQAERDQVIQKLIEKNPLEVPPAMVERATEAMLQGALRNMQRSGLRLDQLQLDWDSLRAELSPKAAEQVKGELLLEAIAARENLDVSDQDVEKKIEELARDSGGSADAVRSALGDPGVKRQFYVKLREEKAIEFLKARAKYS
jgi:trigger factor